MMHWLYMQSFGKPTPSMQKVYPKLLFGRATEYINDGKLSEADDLLSKIINDPNAGVVLPFANFWKGEVAYRLNRYDDVIKYMTAYLVSGGIQGEANPDAAKYVLGYAYLRRKIIHWPLLILKRLRR